MIRIRLMIFLFCFVFLFILPACSDNPFTPSDNESVLPWEGPFVESAPDNASIRATAAALEIEMHAAVPEGTREAIIDHIAVLLAGSARKHWQRDDLPLYPFNPQTESEAFSMAGVTLVFQGSLSGGMWAFSQAVLSDPDDPFALNQLGWALLADGRYEEAKDVLLRAVEIMPELWSAWSSLGYLYEKTGDWRRAEYCYRRALESGPESLFIHLKLGALLLEQGDINGAEYYAEQALSISPDDPEAQELVEQIEDQGGEVEPVQEPSGGVSSSAATDTLHEIHDCSEEHTQWMMTALVPYVEEAYRKDKAHEDYKVAIKHDEQLCREDCHTQPLESWEDCEISCQVMYCTRMLGTIYQQYRDSLTFLNTEMGFHASYRSRYQSCAYSAIEDQQHELSPSEIIFLIDYVDWQIALDEQSFRYSAQNEYEFYLEQRNGLSSACSAPEAIEAMEEQQPEGQASPYEQGIEACLDNFVCLSFEETTIGFSVGVGVAAGGIEADYVTNDLIFSLGAGPDIGVAALSFEVKLSILQGIGLSGSAKLGGPIRATVTRDFWLLSF